jgi:subtilisin-like proprotein convertase family protein
MVQPLGWDGDPAGGQAEYKLGFDDDSFASEVAPSLPLSDAIPTGVSYLLYENWGGTWFDAEKTPTNLEDDEMCWAAAAANILAWTGWGYVGGMTNADEIFAYFQDHWTDEGGLMEYGWDWWFDGTNDSEGFADWSQVDVAGGGFYLSETFSDYFLSDYAYSSAVASISTFLNQGYGVALGIYGPGGHAVTCWGYNYDSDNQANILGLWLSDSDDSKLLDSAPDLLRYYEVAQVDGKWHLQDYFGTNDWYIGAVQALAPKEATPTAPPTSNEIRGTIWNDTNGDGQHQAGENGLAGQTVYLDGNNNGELDVSTTVAGSTTAQPIPDAGTATSTISLTGTDPITDINVALDITHTFRSDLAVYLISPQGTRVLLFNGVGGSGDNFVNTVLDDEATTAIGGGTGTFTGSFRPQQLLSRFDGEAPNGVWTLEIVDCAHLDTGTLNGWSLEIRTSELTTRSDANGAYAFTALADGVYAVRHETPVGWQGTYPAAGVHQVVLQGEPVADVDFMATEIGLPEVVELGEVDYRNLTALNPSSGDYWYSFQTKRQGYLTLEAYFTGSAGGATLTLYDANFTRLATSLASENGERIDWQVGTGETYIIRLSGTQTEVGVCLANLVAWSGDAVTVFGTTSDDQFEFAAGAWHQVTINEVRYEFDSRAVASLSFDGGLGNDSAILHASSGDGDIATLSPTTAILEGTGYRIDVTAVPDIVVVSVGGADAAYLHDSASDDILIGSHDDAQFFGAGFCNRVSGFQNVYAYSTTGNDTAELHDSAGDDIFQAAANWWATVKTASGVLQLNNFDEVEAQSTAGGNDVAWLYDSAGDDTFDGGPTSSVLAGTGFRLEAKNFEEVHAIARAGGVDKAAITGSTGNERLVGWTGETRLYGSNYYLRSQGFDEAIVTAGGGYDVAELYDSPGDDTFQAAANWWATVKTGNTFLRADGFDQVTAEAKFGGKDVAWLYDSQGNDTFDGAPTSSVLAGTGFRLEAKTFEEVHAIARAGGVDKAAITGSTGNERLVGWTGETRLYGSNYYLRSQGFDEAIVTAAGGYDVAELYDSPGDDTFQAAANWWATMKTGNTFLRADGFDQVTAEAKFGGRDVAWLYDSQGNDIFRGGPTSSTLSGAGFWLEAKTFEEVHAVARAGGTDTANFTGTTGDEQRVDWVGETRLYGSSYYLRAQGFDSVLAASIGGFDTAVKTKRVIAVDLALETSEDWLNV